MHVLIVGCGYVGLELGRHLTPDHRVTGVRRGDRGLQAIADAGLEAVRADASNPSDLVALPDVDAVVYAASARGEASARETYVESLRTLIDHFDERRDPPSQFLYTSSTGVYSDHEGQWVDETTELRPTSERERILREAERIALERGSSIADRTVVRFGGIYGPGRSPVQRYLTGPVSPGYGNFGHRADAAGAVAHLLTETEDCAPIVNVVDDQPIDRPELARWIAERHDETPPAVVPLDDRDLADARAERLAANKRVDDDRLHACGYDLRYPSVTAGIQDGLESD
ncbi:NAD(P)H-binding protein [Halanaeroarchaeum sulfurireducens]|uniref:NAD-dependent epimerase/dehydratase n=1 Tax=Halanaeroarchaeum sulfurireducens TaxID=1604004 RepID=A0A0N9MY60_9EURY|nr:NAD(P)H-binding protein [Halanaeroarchaeum sulfurireducens]ALG82926.1 NAD-dependent epimerase/dehydratase [Halanaeroarchaeum sulfurireducens]